VVICFFVMWECVCRVCVVCGRVCGRVCWRCAECAVREEAFLCFSAGGAPLGGGGGLFLWRRRRALGGFSVFLAVFWGFCVHAWSSGTGLLGVVWCGVVWCGVVWCGVGVRRVFMLGRWSVVGR
jgi:hypothetical protein